MTPPAPPGEPTGDGEAAPAYDEELFAPGSCTPVETALLLASGLIHLPGAVIRTGGSPTDTLRVLWERAQAAADVSGRLLLKVALPDGTVVHREFTPGVPSRTLVPQPHREQPDVRWEHAVPDRAGLLATVAAGRRAGQFAGAVIAADRLAKHVRSDLGVHPYAVLAVELHAECAVLAADLAAASASSLIAAVSRHYLAASRASESVRVEQAMEEWLRTAPGDDATRAGLTLAHHVLNLCPAAPELLGRVLLVLDQRLSTTSQAPPASLPIIHE